MSSLIVSTDIVNKLGKRPLLSEWIRLSNAQYATGIALFDSIIDPEKILTSPMITNIIKRPLGIEISIMYKFSLHKVGLPFENIVSVAIEDKQRITERQEKSVIGRALVGGLLLGPLGAVVGGMSGIGTKEKTLFAPDLIMTLTYNDNHEEKIIAFTAKYENRAKLYKGAIKLFGDKLIV